MKVEGDKELIRALREFPDKLSRKVLRTAGTKAARPVQKAARAEAKPASPTIAKSIGTKVKVYKSGNVFVAVGPTRDEKNVTTKAVKDPKTGVISIKRHNPANTAHLVDRGTKPHGLKLFGKIRIIHPGAKAHPFLAPAENRTRSEVEGIYVKELRAGVEKLEKELDK